MPAYRGMKVSGEIGDGVELPPWGPGRRRSWCR